MESKEGQEENEGRMGSLIVKIVMESVERSFQYCNQGPRVNELEGYGEARGQKLTQRFQKR